MNTYVNEPDIGTALLAAQEMFKDERLPFPPMPASLAGALTQQGTGWFATRPMASSPYDWHHFLDQIEEQPGLPDHAVVGFDGHGTNSWAVHFYLVCRGLALFIQLPWGGAYLEPEPARARNVDLFEWAGALQARVLLAESGRKIPEGVRLQVAVSEFYDLGWRWLGAGPDAAAEVPWNRPQDMRATVLQELDEVIAGRAFPDGVDSQERGAP